MLKFKSLAIGLLTTISLLPAAQAMAAGSSNLPAIQKPSGDLQAQVILKIGPQIRRDRVYYPRQDWRLRRQWERERAREARARWEADRYRYRRSYDRPYYPGSYRY
jgi:hypothetical protein